MVNFRFNVNSALLLKIIDWDTSQSFTVGLFKIDLDWETKKFLELILKNFLHELYLIGVLEEMS